MFWWRHFDIILYCFRQLLEVVPVSGVQYWAWGWLTCWWSCSREVLNPKKLQRKKIKHWQLSTVIIVIIFIDEGSLFQLKTRFANSKTRNKFRWFQKKIQPSMLLEMIEIWLHVNWDTLYILRHLFTESKYGSNDFR